VKRLSATEAARDFSAVLDRVEHDGETFVVTRHGTPVARIAPADTSNGRAAKAIIASRPDDPDWPNELRGLRRLLVDEGSRWNA
jgi:prevent-host-death family protein